MHLLDRPLHGQHVGRGGHLGQLDLVGGPLQAALQHPPLGLGRGVADRQPQQEPVELGLGQRVGALELDRVLGGHDQERALQGPGHPVDRHLPLLHRLQQGGLGLGRRAVDLVAQQQVGEHRAGPELEVAGALVVDRGAGDVRRHQVGGELDPGEAQRGHLREGPGDQGLGQARVVVQEHVPVGQQPEQDQLEGAALADHGPLDLVQDQAGEPAQLVQGLGHGRPSRSTGAPLGSRAARAADPLQVGDQLGQGGRGQAGRLPVGQVALVAGEQRPPGLAEGGPGGVGVAVQVDGQRPAQPVGGDRPQLRAEPGVGVEGAGAGQGEQPGQAVQLGRRPRPGPAGPPGRCRTARPAAAGRASRSQVTSRCTATPPMASR